MMSIFSQVDKYDIEKFPNVSKRKEQYKKDEKGMNMIKPYGFEIEDMRHENSYGRGFFSITKENKAAFSKVIELSKMLPDESYNGKKYVYIRAPRGTVEDYCRYNGIDQDDQKLTSNATENFKRIYGENEYVYFVLEIYNSDYGCSNTIIVNQCTMFIDEDDEITAESKELKELKEPDGNDMQVLLWITDEILRILKLMERGEYASETERLLPLRNRYGYIGRKEYESILEGKLIHKRGILRDDERDLFLMTMTSEMRGTLIREMTAGKYYDICAAAYRGLGIEMEGFSSKELYMRYSDGHDAGLTQMDDDDPDEWNRWLSDDNPRGLYLNRKYRGSHPFKVLGGSHSMGILIIPQKTDKGYYFFLTNPSPYLQGYREIEMVRISNEFIKEDIPFILNDVNIIRRIIRKEDNIGITPYFMNDGLNDWKENEWKDNYHDMHISETVNLDEIKDTEVCRKFESAVTWLPVEYLM